MLSAYCNARRNIWGMFNIVWSNNICFSLFKVLDLKGNRLPSVCPSVYQRTVSHKLKFWQSMYISFLFLTFKTIIFVKYLENLKKTTILISWSLETKSNKITVAHWCCEQQVVYRRRGFLLKTIDRVCWLENPNVVTKKNI